MKKKRWYLIYIAAVLMLAAFPFVGMSVAASNETTENKELARFPRLRSDGTWNVRYLSQMGGYFEDHFAFRQELVAANALIRGRLLGVSASDQVLVGKDGWLYYTGTLDDYLGRNQMSEKGLANAVHNIGLMQQYVEDRGSRFLITIAPNKNSVYDSHMPSNYLRSGENNHTRLTPLLKQAGIHYADLHEIFEESGECLYLQGDSHWNNKGALLVCRKLLDGLDREYDGSAYDSWEVRKEHTGDLAEMLYSVAAKPEDNVYYDRIPIYAYVNDVEDTEEDWIETINPNGQGRLLMFRDSFGNSMLPILANEFEYGYFSRLVPYNLSNLDKYHPEYVVVERVERRLSFFAEQPPVMEGPVRVLEELRAAATDTTVSVREDGSWYVVEGTLDSEYTQKDSRVYVSVRPENGESVTYEAFLTSSREEEGWNDDGYQLYLRQASLPRGKVNLDIILVNGSTQTIVGTEELKG
ncbi:MAG: hypothetical protein HFH16_01620 [Ruminococcus sp.]|uniref:AlgX/AlgJ SGNH hydrolase-like domain-containing protein n=1 Tax=Schaedlerella arabinosiphila TaxID=2044587 RepID=A0A3R8LY74_9FIRM|nr:hypothetical protein [Schaedlerella arabinosiphila]MCI8722407.1 hypothetical protein [Ruminococcus sp.]RRK31766.1 hypothetical protein EBB54_10610 [Schaedlerella arabinosiphila]